MNTLNKLKINVCLKFINEAVEILKHLTDGRYTMINYNEDSITVKHVNGQLYDPVKSSIYKRITLCSFTYQFDAGL